ncbi:glutamyl-tRNA amidotransferase alpha subunit [Schizosaccharomyces cryophilus OY26]|uniref:Glutamyl-tRNA(Gln) amidotransferase subunit A, mitochondrial n=1 Tax=Schizosaccharomyces cryophilus (strain OY26 / ATCC MYA-4695 / CBS 11777 / NBRC 106824 / NRRL Y48691) TaxID=653667 RepID=S9XKP9_SCHCR|nr:glutamyl-tRNA amidotransferase alpha subunit [Schizosaccharomyces cryophilus OY26]EPY54291.1 glutamyl-tRNA amidotransferase alpha subunit [Schizosaccharomyces cryophilus OY26]
MAQNLVKKCISVAAKDVKVNSLTSFHTADSIKSVIKGLVNKNTANLPLNGKILTVKDNICTKYWPTSCGSRILNDYISPFEATLVRTLKENGGIIIGKTNMDEFAMGTNTNNALHGQTAFPLIKDKSYQVGGSSGGCAASVAADICYASIGTDTGGSVRLPAAYVGCVGFKPSFGRISRYGAMPFANSMDTMGIIAKDVDSIITVYGLLSHADPKDATCLTTKMRSKIEAHCQKHKVSNKPTVIGIPTNWNVTETDTEVLSKWNEFISLLKSNNFEIKEIQLPYSLYGLSVYTTLAYAEGASNLARYNNAIFGSDCQNQGRSMNPRSAFFGEEVKKRLLLGAYSLSTGKKTGIHRKAQILRRAVQKEMNGCFRIPSLHAHDPSGDIDFIVTPSFLKPSMPIGTKQPYDFLSDSMLVPANLAGLPSISIPFGQVHGGLPMGIQLIAQYGDDNALLSFSKCFC